MERHIVYFRGTFNGLYEWGNGWNMEAYYKWKDFWTNRKGDIFWKYFTFNDKVSDIEYLVSNGGSIYLHPMSFDGGLFDCGCTCCGKYFSSEIKELYKICDECAYYCGGTFSMVVSDEKGINVGEMKEYFGE